MRNAPVPYPPAVRDRMAHLSAHYRLAGPARAEYIGSDLWAISVMAPAGPLCVHLELVTA